MRFHLFVTLAILMVSCAVNPVTGKKDLMLLSEKQEIAMGREYDPEIVRTFGLYRDPGLEKLVDSLGQRMAGVSHRPHLEYIFRVLDSPVVNAFALPGGYIYFTRGILAHFSSTAELAGVLGHEIGHVTARHSAKQYSSQIVFQAGYVAGILLSPEFASISGTAREAVNMLFLQFSRDNESQSDQLGVEYSSLIGYDARELARFFVTLDYLQTSSGADAIPPFMSTHPDPGDRQIHVAAYAEKWQSEKPTQDWLIDRN